jgi:N-methylhydantoinase A
LSLWIAIDTGGTFTDVVAIDDASGDQFAIKTPSTPSDPSRGLVNGIEEVVRAAGRAAGDLSHVLHGSTTATNAVLEHKFEGLGLIVTRGFRHIIEIARQSVPDGYGNSFFWVKPPRLVPLHLVREVDERLTYEGRVLAPLDEASVVRAASELVELGVRCIGVCLLHSYANDAHERRVGALIAERFPEVFVSLSSVVLPEYREYERAMTTLIDVMVKPYCKTYLARARARIGELAGGHRPFLIMQSNGGVVTSDTAGEKPVTMLMSGPAGGVLGATHIAGLAGYKDILTIDVGGTSTDVSLIRNLTPQLTSHSLIEHYPVKTPMLDIVSVGSGGGSLAWIDEYGALKVGPRSAGAEPGPICYRRGGTQPTVTDAAVVLGRLPGSLIGGGLPLDAGAARTAFDAFGRKLNLTAEDAAAGVIEIAAASQVQGIRQVTTTRGVDPSEFAMVAFGGAGGLFAADVADFLGIATAISPPNPGNLSAFGLHVSDIKRDYVRTFVRQQSGAVADDIEAVWAELERRGRAEIAAEGVRERDIALVRSADVRYVGEGHEVPVPIPAGSRGVKAVAAMWQAFHRVHERTFGFHYEGIQDVEVVSLRVQAVGRAHRPDVRKLPRAKAARAKPAERRRVYWRGDGWVDCAIYRRDRLGTSFKAAGPAIVEEYGSTLVVPASWKVRTDAYGNLIVEKRT